MTWFRDSVDTYRRPTAPTTSTSRPATAPGYGSLGLLADSKAEVAAAKQATQVATSTSIFGTQSMAMGNPKVGPGIVVMPNPNWYVSSADVYGSMDPNDPSSMVNQEVVRDAQGNIVNTFKTPMWNYATESKQEGLDAFNDDFIVSPMMRVTLEAYAKTIHPSKEGTGVWEDAVVASMSMSARGKYVTPIEIVRGWLQEWQDQAKAGNVDSGGGSGYYGGGGGFGGGGGGGQINLMNEEDARAVVNQLSSQMLGRTVSEKEFQQYYKSLRNLQMSNPSSVSFDENGNTIVEDAVGAEGLRYNLEEQMRNTEDFVTNSVGTQALGLLENYIASRRTGG